VHYAINNRIRTCVAWQLSQAFWNNPTLNSVSKWHDLDCSPYMCQKQSCVLKISLCSRSPDTQARTHAHTHKNSHTDAAFPRQSRDRDLGHTTRRTRSDQTVGRSQGIRLVTTSGGDSGDGDVGTDPLPRRSLNKQEHLASRAACGAAADAGERAESAGHHPVRDRRTDTPCINHVLR
jgi:hypothetical protein